MEPEDIETSVLTPKRVRTDEGTIEERPIDDVIKADNHAAAKRQSTQVPYGMRIARTVPPGTINPNTTGSRFGGS